MVLAMWRASIVNMRPALRLGDCIPRIPVYVVPDCLLGDLSQIVSGPRPVVLNFGSCT